MEAEKPRKEPKGGPPVLQSAIRPLQPAIGPGPEPALALRAFEGRSVAAKEFFERDVSRLRESLAPARLEPKILLCSPDMRVQIRQDIDLRSGQVASAKMLPDCARLPANIGADHPLHPENQLSSAMKKLGHKP